MRERRHDARGLRRETTGRSSRLIGVRRTERLSDSERGSSPRSRSSVSGVPVRSRARAGAVWALMAGPRPGSRCTACLHAQSAALNAMINSGAGQVAVAKSFGLDRGVIRRHVDGLHVGVEPSSTTPLPLPHDGSEVERLVALRARVEDDVRRGAVRSVDATGPLRALNKDILAMRGGVVPTVVGIRDVEGLEPLFLDMLRGMERFPEARLAMVEILDRHWPDLTEERR